MGLFINKEDITEKTRKKYKKIFREFEILVKEIKGKKEHEKRN